MNGVALADEDPGLLDPLADLVWQLTRSALAEEATSDTLKRWMRAGKKEPACIGPPGRFLALLRDDHSDRKRLCDFKIGPSYLMRPLAEKPSGLERIWRHDLLPLLEEHYYGRLTHAQVQARFGLDAIRKKLAPDLPGGGTGLPGADEAPSRDSRAPALATWPGRTRAQYPDSPR